MATECDVQSELQVLNPIGTTVEPSGSRPVEDGITPLIQGQSYVDVVFTAMHPTYNLDELVIENFFDNPPLCICIGPISYEDELGFRVMFTAAPDSANYQLRWRITE